MTKSPWPIDGTVSNLIDGSSRRFRLVLGWEPYSGGLGKARKMVRLGSVVLSSGINAPSRDRLDARAGRCHGRSQLCRGLWRMCA